MKESKSNRTEHAIEQMARRNINEQILDMLESYGESAKCRDGGRKIAFGKASRTLIRREIGRKALRELSKYRNIYAVLCNERVVTVARSRTPLFR
jgi:hypothetical protein